MIKQHGAFLALQVTDSLAGEDCFGGSAMDSHGVRRDFPWENNLTPGIRIWHVSWIFSEGGSILWQIAPAGLGDMLRDPDPKKVERVTNAFLKMRKLDIGALEKAYRG